MISRPTLADTLRQFMQNTAYPITPGLLAKLSGLPKSTIINWLDGRVTRPRHWEDLLRVADALRLDEPTANQLLLASGHQPIAELRVLGADVDQELFRYWPRTAVPAPIDHTAGLPTPATPLIGRTQTLHQLYALLQQPEVRLVTLTGVGGTGKTRLAIQAAIDLQPTFADRVHFVALASLSDADLVLPTIAQALGLMPVAGSSILEQLRATLRNHPLLLILDNFEHVQRAVTDIAALLAAAPCLTLLVTSRVRLHVDGEHIFDVPALPIPPISADINALLENPAVALFAQRAHAADPDFALSGANARIIAEICAKLDGLPLSIELAAARVKLLTPKGVLARLSNRLNLLRWGSHSLLQRHRTLRDTLDWSYTLLTANAQVLFRRMAIFMGGCTVEAIETIAGFSTGSDGDTLDALMVLTDSSLLQIDTALDEPRYQMLETLREYAAEKLNASPEGDTLRQKHASYYLRLAEAAEPFMIGADQIIWLNRLDSERDNIRAALGNALKQGDTETVGRMAASLRLYWITRGYLEEGRRWLALALLHPAAIPADQQAKMLLVSGRLARQQGDLALAEAHVRESLAYYRTCNDRLGIASALGVLGVIAYDQAAFADARAFHEESLALRQVLGDSWGVAATLTNLGEVTRHQGDLTGSRILHEQSVEYFRTLGDSHGLALALTNLGLVLLDSGDIQQAARHLEESLVLWHRIAEQVDIAECLEGLAGVAVANGDDLRAARLWGVVETLRKTTGATPSPVDRERFAQATQRMYGRSAPAALSAAYTASQSMSLKQAVVFALSGERVTINDV